MPRRVLLIGSGGCTAFTLRLAFPDLPIDILDPNPAQLALIREKCEALQSLPPGELALRMNVGTDDPRGLNATGNFEALFRGFRNFLNEFVASRQELLHAFESDAALVRQLELCRGNPYWRCAFELFFSDVLLNTVFGPAATQHAPKGSYPAYFQNALERGMRQAGAHANPFLHHIFLGHYLADHLPAYLRTPPRETRFGFIEGDAGSVPDFGAYGLIHLSNIFDWMDASLGKTLARRISLEMRPGSAVTLRQLNHSSDLAAWFEGLTFDEELNQELMDRDRSLFYCRIRAGFKR